MENEEYIRHWYKRLKHYRDDFSDEILGHEVTSLSPDRRYKCRKAWWSLWIWAVNSIDQKGLLPEELSERYPQVFNNYNQRTEKDDFGIIPEDITRANEVIDGVLHTLEARFGQSMHLILETEV